MPLCKALLQCGSFCLRLDRSAAALGKCHGGVLWRMYVAYRTLCRLRDLYIGLRSFVLGVVRLSKIFLV